jgi:hypothetical protein
MRSATPTSRKSSPLVAATGGVSMRIVTLLAVASFVNYIDRGNLAARTGTG